MDQLLAMRVFARVVETGSFTRAADGLGVPRATVTKLVQSLESHLRLTLLRRSTRQVAVTEDGQAYYDHVRGLLAELDTFESGIASAGRAPRGTLRVDVSVLVARHIIIPALPDFHARYPEVRLELGVSDRPLDFVLENVDCALRRGPLLDPGLVARRLCQSAIVTCASPEYIERHGMPTVPRDLETTHPVVGFSSTLSHNDLAPLTFARDGERIEVRGRSIVSVNDGSAYLALAMAGMGVIQAPAFMVSDALREGKLRPVLREWSVEPGSLYAVYPPNRHMTARVRAFVDWAVQLFAAHDSAPPCPVDYSRRETVKSR